MTTQLSTERQSSGLCFGCSCTSPFLSVFENFQVAEIRPQKRTLEVVSATEINGEMAFLESDQFVEEEVRNDA